MPYLNEVNLIGNVGMKPEIRTTKDGKSKIASFSLATTRKWKKDGIVQERTEWHRIKAYGPKADLIAKYVEKGEPLWIRGELRLESFSDKDGTNWKVSEIALKQLEFLGAKKDKANEEVIATAQDSDDVAEDETAAA